MSRRQRHARKKKKFARNVTSRRPYNATLSKKKLTRQRHSTQPKSQKTGNEGSTSLPLLTSSRLPESPVTQGHPWSEIVFALDSGATPNWQDAETFLAQKSMIILSLMALRFENFPRAALSDQFSQSTSRSTFTPTSSLWNAGHLSMEKK